MNHRPSESSAEVCRAAENFFDVAILGGGFAGETLALHLALHMPELSVAVVEPNPIPPRFAHKIGESSLGPQGTYLAHWLQLDAYLREQHIEKFGTRYFFGDPAGPFAERPEIGARHAVTEFPIYEYQVDRGKFEADLREKVVDMGVTWLPYRVTEIQFGQESADHTLHLHNRARRESRTVCARWVIDATGRRRFLHRLRHQTTPSKGRCSAVWFRVPGWIDVDDFAPPTETAWRERVSPRHPRGIPFGRFNSTNHFCGTGYWVWLIPLPDQVMSVGIVTDEALVPFESYRTADLALSWLAANEPHVAAAVEGREMFDFRTMRRYSYPVDDFLSTERWALTGDALGFGDPFYSPGGDMIAIANLIIVESIRRERNGALDDETCRRLTESMRRIQAIATDAIQSIYPCLGASRVAGAHIVWDFLSLVTPMVLVIRNFNAHLYDYLSSPEGHRTLDGLADLHQEMGQLMASWTQEDCCQLAPRSILDHTEKLYQLTGNLWSEASGKELDSLINFLFDHLKTVANAYRTQGLAWSLFDA